MFYSTTKERRKGASMARPRVEIDRETFEGLCEIQCTADEIAHFFRCSVDTVERWCKREYGRSFAEAYKNYSAGGKISLRRAQFRLAQKNASMAIWLGKQYLGQTDAGSGTDEPPDDGFISALKSEAGDAWADSKD